MVTKEDLEDIAGEICRVVLPVKDSYFVGRGTDTAICTLGSVELLRQISRSSLMEKVSIVGRLLSENKGVEVLVRYACSHPSLRTLVVCGHEVQGHLPGQALIALSNNGIDEQGRIIGALGHRPFLGLTEDQVKEFTRRVRLIDLVGVDDYDTVASSVPG